MEQLFTQDGMQEEAVFLDIGVNAVGRRRDIMFLNDIQFNEAYNKTTQHVTTGHIRSHFRAAYESFAAPGNIFGEDPEKHQDRLFEELTEMKRFMDVRVGGGASGAAEKMVHPDPAWFVSLTPSVAESRWDAAFQRYLNGSLRSFSGVFLESTARFRVLFELQRFYGEEKTADFMGWFAVQVRYAPDASPAVLLVGLGSRLAGTLYLDYVERRADAGSVYKENWHCLVPSANDSDSDDREDLVAASAAMRVIWDTFQHGRRAGKETPL
ncbi:hypothetical protein V5799_027491, partial [Amblyomma americanum]